MSKRKREDELEDQLSIIQNQAIRIKVSRLKARFDNGVQQLTAQLKLARGFDRQKMTRRVKQAGSDQGKLERLKAEIEALKRLNEGTIARNYLLKQCVRTKRIAEAEAFRTLFGEDAAKKVKPTASVAESNVLGRMFKSDPVSEVLPEIMKGVREVLGVDKPASRQVENGTQHESVKAKRPRVAVPDESKQTTDFTGFSDADLPAPFAEQRATNGMSEEVEFDTGDDETMAEYEARLAGSSDEEDDDGKEQTNGQDHERDLDSMEITSDEDAALGDEASELENDMSEDEAKMKIQAKKTKARPPQPTSTSFLPSLMHGGYYSGGESGDEDDEPDGYDPDKAYAAATKETRKNRRGQRARQAIAEKKHGAKAKHLVRVNGAEGVHGDRQRFISKGTGKSDGWDARRGAVGPDDKRRPESRKPVREPARGPNRSERRKDIGQGQSAESAPTSRDTKKTSTQNEKMHPSWEAARKRKLETANAGAAAFKGKKITFD